MDNGYQTQEQRDQAAFQLMPQKMPADLTYQDLLTTDNTPAVLYVPCPHCGGVFTVFNEIVRQRILADVPVPVQRSTFVDRAGDPYLVNGDNVNTITCLDCGITVRELVNDYAFNPFSDVKHIKGAQTLPPPTGVTYARED